MFSLRNRHVATVLMALLTACWLGNVPSTALAEGRPIPPPLETVTVPFTSGGADSTIALDDGVLYWLLAEGVTSAGHSGQENDAEWWRSPGVPPYPEWSEYADWTGYPPNSMDLIMDGIGVDWRGSALLDPDPIEDFDTFAEHIFSPSHKYWTPWVGDGTTIHFLIVDHPSHYHDNSGSLTVGIYQTPEPATLSLLALGGLAAMRRRRMRSA